MHIRIVHAEVFQVNVCLFEKFSERLFNDKCSTDPLIEIFSEILYNLSLKMLIIPCLFLYIGSRRNI